MDTYQLSISYILQSDDSDKRLILPYILGISMGISSRNTLYERLQTFYKSKQPPAIPYVILVIPVTVLFCYCSTKHVKSLLLETAL